MLSHFLVALVGFAASAPAAAQPFVQTAPSRAADDSETEFPEEWFWRLGSAGKAHRAMVGKAPPALTVRDWRGSDAALEPIAKASGDVLTALKGKVVVVDFWATWCGPCRKALPENVAMVKELGSKGLIVIGVHDAARGSERMDEIAKGASINYPLAIDDGGASAKAWNVGFWPTYAVIDRAGTLRAIGLQPERVRAVAEKLLAEGGAKPSKPETTPSSPPPIKNGRELEATTTPVRLETSLLEGDTRRRAKLADFDLCPVAPSLGAATQWTDSGGALGTAKSLDELKGKIVVLDFWATWCGPCIASIPMMNEVARKYSADGVVILGVCHKDGGAKMLETARAKGIAYPICLDAMGEANVAFKVDSYPDYYIVDRAGRLRGADIASAQLESAIKKLIAEKP